MKPGLLVQRPRVGISRCLLGDDVRYDGGNKRDLVLIEELGAQVEWVSVCPEVEVGMGTPREPIQLVRASNGVVAGTARIRLLGVESGKDWTQRMTVWARERAHALAAARLSGFVLKKDSPSCGPERVSVWDANPESPTPNPDLIGRGLFAQALGELLPDLPVQDEERLQDPRIRAEFLRRVDDYRIRTHGSG